MTLVIWKGGTESTAISIVEETRRVIYSPFSKINIQTRQLPVALFK